MTRSRTCQELQDSFAECRTDLAPGTIKAYGNTWELFFKCFSPTAPIETITTEKLVEWRTSLQATKYAPASIASYFKDIGTHLNWAVRQGWLTKNPLEGIPRGSFINRDKDRIITMEEYAKLLDACPSQEWRAIIALARIGGIRCPSELQQLRWSDVCWEKYWFLVQ